MSGEAILEREHELEALSAAAEEAKAGDGSVVLIVGEAGIGKSSLVRALNSLLPGEVRLLVGYCDDLATPRVLGPLRDLVGSVGTTLTQALESADRGQVSDALRAELDRAEQPSVLVVEDVHWADEATLDVLRFLARRIASLPAVLVLTYRDVQLASDHPLQQLLGLAAGTPRLRRLTPARLSPDAVRRLGARTGIDADRVFAVTSGNPFFVAEVLASGDVSGVPHSVAEAVRARLGDLDAATRNAVEQLAVIPSATERWLVEAVVPGGLGSLAVAERRGVLAVFPTRVAFAHELARRAVVDSMPAARRVACNEAVLAALLDRRAEVDLSRIVHHAAQAGAVDVIVQHGPAAAREAAAAGAHREAVAHYRLVLDHRQAFPPDVRADLLDEYAVECHTVGLSNVGVPALEDAIHLRRTLGDPRKLGLSLRWLSRIHWWAGSRARAEVSGAEAIQVLESAGDDRALALALSNQSQLHMLAGRRADCIAVGQRAVAMARGLGDAALLSHALDNVGTSMWDEGRPEGQAMLEESLSIAVAAGEAGHACRAYTNIVWHLLDVLGYAEAERILEDAIELADEAEFEVSAAICKSLGAWSTWRAAGGATPSARSRGRSTPNPSSAVRHSSCSERSGPGGASRAVHRCWSRHGRSLNNSAKRSALDLPWLHCSRRRGCREMPLMSRPRRCRHTRMCAASVASGRLPDSGIGSASRVSACRSTKMITRTRCWRTGDGSRLPRRGGVPVARTKRRSRVRKAPTPRTCSPRSPLWTPWAPSRLPVGYGSDSGRSVSPASHAVASDPRGTILPDSPSDRPTCCGCSLKG